MQPSIREDLVTCPPSADAPPPQQANAPHQAATLSQAANHPPVTAESLPVASSSRAAEWVDLASLEGVACPCGVARRAFAERSDFPATVHLTEISTAARTHYHRRGTETYVVLECGPGAAIELDGVSHPVHPGVAILIPPLVRHRAVGEMKVIIFCLPKFDPSDEYFD